MVTKQEQLELIAKECHAWKGHDFILVSDTWLGCRIPVTAGWHLITREEWQQERDKMRKQADQAARPTQDNSWHERGELPPVGCECEIMHRCWIEPNKVKIAAITKEYVIVVDGQREQHYYLRDITFRPLRTERKKAIDEMVYEFINHYGDPKGGKRYLLIAAKLYDAGYRKEQSK